MTAQRCKEIVSNRYRYGDTLLLVPRENMGGTRARFFFEQIELHFRDMNTSLIVDLRQTAFIDSEGAALLEFSRRRHAGLHIVGRPREFDNLPPSIRAALAALRPAPSIETALSTLHRRPLARHRWDVKRRHCRFPVEIPVEIVSRDLSAAAMLQDLSIGGGRLTSLSPGLIRQIRASGRGSGTIAITGIGSDPLGREVAAHYDSAAIASRAVHTLPGLKGLGVQFSGASPNRD